MIIITHNIKTMSSKNQINKMIQYKTILDDQEGMYQEDIQQWHYVTPINTIKDKLGYRDILGIDIILNT